MGYCLMNMENAMWGLPILAPYLGLNIPILLCTTKVVGKTFVIRTLYANIITSFRLVLFNPCRLLHNRMLLIVI